MKSAVRPAQLADRERSPEGEWQQKVLRVLQSTADDLQDWSLLPDAVMPVPAQLDRFLRMKECARALAADLRDAVAHDEDLFSAADVLDRIQPRLDDYARFYKRWSAALSRPGRPANLHLACLADLYVARQVTPLRLARLVVEHRRDPSCASGISALLPAEWAEHDAESLAQELAARLNRTLKARRQSRND